MLDNAPQLALTLPSDPWDPDTITQYFARLRKRLDLEHLNFKGLRRFMDTYGQELGFSLAQVSMRAGHDPAVAAKHYTGRVAQTDKDLAEAIGRLVEQDSPSDLSGDVFGIPPGFSAKSSTDPDPR